MSEQFSLWAPLPNLLCDFRLGTVLAEDGLLSVGLIEESGRVLRVDFQSLIGLRLLQREFAPRRLLEFETGRDGYGALWQVAPSLWPAELGLAADDKRHYFLLTESEIIEVLTTEEPHASWLESFFGDAL